MIALSIKLTDALSNSISFLASLSLRIYLAPIFILAGINKLQSIESVAYWFGELGIPMPTLMAYSAGITEFVGGILLLVGFLTRLSTIPLMFTMVVAATTAHWDNGWHVLPDEELTVPWEWRKDLVEEGAIRKERVKNILGEHSNYEWITEAGPITILKNGIEWAATYFLMLLTLFVLGPGRWISLDYWLRRLWYPKPTPY